MARLFLCEKPSQARDIARVLGATRKGDGCLHGVDITVTWCIGHLLKMVPPEAYSKAYRRWDLNDLPIVPKTWQLEVPLELQKQFKAIKRCLSKSTEVVIATDADREGETIAREILERCHWKGQILRLWLSALDENSIQKALNALLPGDKTAPLYAAGLGRARADWLVGMNLSRLYSLMSQKCGNRGLLSVGRVQTPTLNLVVTRDLEIEQFRPITYFELWADFQTSTGQFSAKWIVSESEADLEGHCLQRAHALSVERKIQGVEGRVEKSETKGLSEAPPLPFDLSSLQQEASKRYGMKVQDVLTVAQSLYETHKVITYPRTDCPYLPMMQHSDAPKILSALAAIDPQLQALVRQADPNLQSKAWNDKKITAHHAIIPNSPNKGKVDLNKLSASEKQIYDLILRRYLAQFFPAYQYDQIIIEVQVAGEGFRASGRQARHQGWKVIFEALGSDPASEKRTREGGPQFLPDLVPGDSTQTKATEIKTRQTQAPSHFTEGTLIAAMKTVSRQVEDSSQKAVLKETSGLGTEATRAAIIETLLRRGFIRPQGKKQIVSTEAGRALIAAVPDAVKNPATTARWEQALEEIAQGQGSLDTFVQEQTTWITAQVEAAQKDHSSSEAFSHLEKTGPQQRASLGACPECQQRVYENQKAYYCSDSPSGCSFILWKSTLARLGKKVVTKKELSTLLRGRPLGLKGLKSKTGKQFDAQGSLVKSKDYGWQIELNFAEGKRRNQQTKKQTKKKRLF